MKLHDWLHYVRRLLDVHALAQNSCRPAKVGPQLAFTIIAGIQAGMLHRIAEVVVDEVDGAQLLGGDVHHVDRELAGLRQAHFGAQQR